MFPRSTAPGERLLSVVHFLNAKLRAAHMVAYGLIHEGDKLLRGFVYLARQPAFNDARRGNDIEMRHHFHFRIAAGRIQHADILTKLLDSAVDDGIYIRFKKAFEAVAPDGAQRAQADGPVLVKILEKLQEPVLPQQRSLMAAQKRNGLLLKHPAHEVIHVLKMIIEVLAADPGKLGYVADGYLIKRLHRRMQRRHNAAAAQPAHARERPYMHIHPGAYRRRAVRPCADGKRADEAARRRRNPPSG